MRSSKSLDLTQGPIAMKLLQFVIPVFISAMFQRLYVIADRVVVGQFAQNGTQALAAIGCTGPATELVLDIFLGVSLGGNIACANLRGARDEKGVQDCMHTAMLFAAVSGVVLLAVGVVLADPILKALDTPDACIDQAVLYVRIYFLGVPGSLIYNFGANLLRANGDAKRPMYILSLTGLVNVMLNLILVIGFHLDVAGVAIATITAQYLSATAVLFILISPKGGYRMQFRKLRIHRRHLISILRLGIPGGFNSIVFTMSNSIILTAINSFNSININAARTAVADLGAIVNVVIGAFHTGCISFSGQCFGAKQYRRIDKLAWNAVWIGGVGTLAAAALCTVFRNPLLGMFDDNPEVILVATVPLMIQVWFYVLYLVSQVPLGCLRGMKWSAIPTTLNLIGICVPRIIWCALIFPLNRQLWFLYVCYPISWVFSASMQWGCYFVARRKLKQKHRQVAALKE